MWAELHGLHYVQQRTQNQKVPKEPELNSKHDEKSVICKPETGLSKEKRFLLPTYLPDLFTPVGILKLGFNIHAELMATHTDTKEKKKTEEGF